MTNEYEKGRKPEDNDPGKPQTHPGIQGPRTDLRKFLYQHHCCPARASLITLTNAPSARTSAETTKIKKHLAISPEGARTRKISPITSLKPRNMGPGNLKCICVVVICLSPCRCWRWCAPKVLNLFRRWHAAKAERGSNNGAECRLPLIQARGQCIACSSARIIKCKAYYPT